MICFFNNTCKNYKTKRKWITAIKKQKNSEKFFKNNIKINQKANRNKKNKIGADK